jgi:4'-phosphopantetheinyl transferase
LDDDNAQATQMRNKFAEIQSPNTIDARFELQPGQVDIWRLDLNAFQEPSLLRSYRNLLSREELDRLQRFAFDDIRQNYLLSHALTRIVLAGYERVLPSALSFTRNEFGRPELSDSQAGLRFNLSHVIGSAALAITKNWDIGIDLECDDRPISPLPVAERYFAAAEIDWLRRQMPESQKSAFTGLWSLKEAYLKARGTGLYMALDDFAIDVADSDHPRLAFQAGVEDDPNDWKLYLFRPAANCALSVAIRCGATAEPDLATFELASPGLHGWLTSPEP